MHATPRSVVRHAFRHTAPEGALLAVGGGGVTQQVFKPASPPVQSLDLVQATQSEFRQTFGSASVHRLTVGQQTYGAAHGVTVQSHIYVPASQPLPLLLPVVLLLVVVPLEVVPPLPVVTPLLVVAPPLLPLLMPSPPSAPASVV